MASLLITRNNEFNDESSSQRGEGQLVHHFSFFTFINIHLLTFIIFSPSLSPVGVGQLAFGVRSAIERHTQVEAMRHDNHYEPAPFKISM